MSQGAEPRRRRSEAAPPPGGVQAGEREPIFTYLPEEVRLNMQRQGSESSLLWNAFYLMAHEGVSLRAWTELRPLWGSPVTAEKEDRLVPYFWGFRVDGTRLARLPEAALAIAGREDRLEVDLYLKGDENLVAVEAKIEGEPGRCGRFESNSCPEILGVGGACRYWEGESPFSALLDFGSRPQPGDAERPSCARHYQLARTLLMAERLGRELQVVPHVCLLVPRRQWPAMRPGWLDFADRVRDEATWRRLRVIAWEDIARLRD